METFVIVVLALVCLWWSNSRESRKGRRAAEADRASAENEKLQQRISELEAETEELYQVYDRWEVQERKSTLEIFSRDLDYYKSEFAKWWSELAEGSDQKKHIHNGKCEHWAAGVAVLTVVCRDVDITIDLMERANREAVTKGGDSDDEELLDHYDDQMPDLGRRSSEEPLDSEEVLDGLWGRDSAARAHEALKDLLATGKVSIQLSLRSARFRAETLTARTDPAPSATRAGTEEANSWIYQKPPGEEAEGQPREASWSFALVLFLTSALIVWTLGLPWWCYFLVFGAIGQYFVRKYNLQP